MMKSEEFTEMREMIIAKQVARILPELKLVDVSDYICYIHNEHFANICDIIDAATELHFFPHTLRFGNGGCYKLDWDSTPTISLDMEFSNLGVTVYFRLTLSAEIFHVQLDNIIFEKSENDPELNTQQLINAFNDARLRK